MADFYLGKHKNPDQLIAHTFLVPPVKVGENYNRVGVAKFMDLETIVDDANVLAIYHREDGEDEFDYMSGKSFKAYAMATFPTFLNFRVSFTD
jgi:hypothetical protein